MAAGAAAAGRWLGEEVFLHLVPPIVGLVAGAVVTVDFGLPERLAVGALAGEGLGIAMHAWTVFRTRDLRRRAIIEVAEAAIALRSWRLFTQRIPGEDIRGWAELPLGDAEDRLRAGTLNFPWQHAERRWASAWSDLLRARRELVARAGPFAFLLDSHERRRFQLVVKDLTAAIAAAAQLWATWDELAAYEQWGVRNDSQHDDLEKERAEGESELLAALARIAVGCAALERAAVPYREVPDAALEAQQARDLAARGLRVLKNRGQYLLKDGAPSSHLEASTLAGVKDVDLRMIARDRAFDFAGVRASEGWGNFGASLENAGQRFDHLTYRQRERLDDRASSPIL